MIRVATMVLRWVGTTTVKKALSGEAPSVRDASTRAGSSRASAG